MDRVDRIHFEHVVTILIKIIEPLSHLSCGVVSALVINERASIYSSNMIELYLLKNERETYFVFILCALLRTKTSLQFRFR